MAAYLMCDDNVVCPNCKVNRKEKAKEYVFVAQIGIKCDDCGREWVKNDDILRPADPLGFWVKRSGIDMLKESIDLVGDEVLRGNKT